MRTLLLAVLLSLAPVYPAVADEPELPGADLFVMPREAVVREKPKESARALGVLPEREGQRGLFGRGLGGSGYETSQLALLWVLNQSDGRHTLLDIAERAKLPFHVVRGAADALEAAALLRREVPRSEAR